jgi:hypothetical protein
LFPLLRGGAESESAEENPAGEAAEGTK